MPAMANLRLGLATLAGAVLLGLAGCAPKSGSDSTANYPNKTITLICPWSPGGGTDRLTRFMADQLQKELGQPTVVVNRTGGSGAVGHSAGALAPADGHTLTMATFELSTMHRMGISDLTWENFAPILQMNADAAAIMVRSDSPWESLDEFLDDVRANPGKLTMSGTAAGGAWDLARAGLLLAADIPVDALRWIPSKGSAPSVVDLLGGHIDAICCSLPEAIAQIEAGEFRALAAMSPQRLKDYPNIPTVRENGVDWDAVAWRGLMAPKDTPPQALTTLQEAFGRIVASPEYAEFMRKNGFAIEIRLGPEFAGFLSAQDAQWREVITAAGYAQ
ncbi:MAG: tripartite tricarboxylate transporter substrate binding protein [Synoicihabitans sp.]